MIIVKFLLLLTLAEMLVRAVAPRSWFKGENQLTFAKFTPGAIVSEVRNKIAATVYSKNASGAIIRNRVTPINRRSTGQTAQRQLLSSLASGWRGLTQAQRDGWNAAAANFPQSDSLGQTVILTGEQFYVRCNANLTLINESLITAAPIPTSFPAITAAIASLTVAAFTVGFTPDPVPAGFTLVIRATRPLSAGKQFFAQSEFRFVQLAAAASASPANINTAYEAIFGDKTGQVGQKVAVECFLVEESSGLAGIPVRAIALIA